MSAIAGLWRFDGKPEAGAGCTRMLAAQEIYGPHDLSQWVEEPLAMGRRLFRTLPEDVHDRHVLFSTDRRFVLVADVRLDNRADLERALSLSPTGLCDAAILLESLVRWGEGALDQLVGDFAFALWDSRQQSLLLARDFLGQRPLHYYRSNGLFAFATMPKGLHALSEISYAADEVAMAEFLTLMPQVGPRSFFKDIARVEAGHVVTVTRQGVTSRRYWEPSPPSSVGERRRDYAEGLRYHLDQATQSRLRGANGVVATHLSAGFDSASVTATAARLLAPLGGKVLAFTAVPREGFDGTSPHNGICDEGPLAAATAAMYPNIEHKLIRSGGLSPLADLDRYFYLFDRPALNLCNRVWLTAIDAAARDRKVRVLLTGQMGNMSVSYAGLEYLPGQLGKGRLIALFRECARLVAHGTMSWPAALATAIGPYMPAWLWQRLSAWRGRERNVLEYTAIREAQLRELNLHSVARQRGLDFCYRPRKDGFESRLWVLRRIDLGNYNKGTLAGWGIDQRDPTADRRLVEYCLSAPMEQFLSQGETRVLARRTLNDRLPQAVMDERGKGYQAADWHEGFAAARGEIAEELGRLSKCETAARALDVQRLQGLVKNWPASGWGGAEVEKSYRLALLRGVSAGHFLRKVARSNA